MSNLIPQKNIGQSNPINQWKFLTLSAIAYGALADKEETEARFNTALRYAFKGYKKLALTRHYGVKAVEIEMLPWKQIAFPNDMVDWDIIGFRVGDMVKVMTRDRNIPKVWDTVNGKKQEHTPNFPALSDAGFDNAMFPLLGNGINYGGTTVGQFFGNVMQYNFLGYFDVDYEQRVINFKETVTGYKKVYLEYLTDGINYEGSTVIHPYLEDPLTNYIHWQFAFHDKKVSKGEAREYERIYLNSLDELDVMRMQLTLDDVREALRTGYRLTPKN